MPKFTSKIKNSKIIMKIGVISLFIFLFAAAAPTFGQQPQRLDKLKKGHELYTKKKYAEAIAEYEALMASGTGAAIMGLDSRINLADCYRQVHQPVKAELIYRDLVEQAAEDRPEVLLNYGEVLVGVGKYEEAKQQFEKYALKRPDDPASAQFIERCNLIQAIRPIFFDLKFERQEVASTPTTEEFGLTYYGNGVVFASNQIVRTTDEWKGIASVDMFYSEIAPDGNLVAPRLLSKRLNSTSRHDGPATFSRDGKTIYFAHSTKASANAPAGTVPMQIVSAKNENGKWSKPEVLPFNIPDLVFTHPCLSADGTQLYFASNMSNGGMGGLDIWVSTFRGGKWSNPRNLGAEINTKDDDAFPFLHPDGTLYFASKGHGNYGGYDLFRALSVGNGTDFQKPENIGQPVNSAFDDTYFLLSDEQTNGYIASNREGSDDIFYFKIDKAEPKPLPSNIAPRAAAIFNDTADVEGLVVENNNPKNTVVDNESKLDSMLKNGTAVVDNPPKKDPNNPNNPNTNPDNPDNPDTNPDNPDTTDVVNVDNPDNPDKPKNPRNTPDPKEIFGDGGKTGKGNKKDVAELKVELKLIDAADNSILGEPTVTLKNAKTGKTETVTVENGMIFLTLQADQKYEVIADCEGYYSGRLPITTMGAYKSETAEGDFPLIRKE